MNFTIDIESVAHLTSVMLAGCGSSSVLSPVYQYTFNIFSISLGASPFTRGRKALVHFASATCSAESAKVALTKWVRT